MNTARDIACKIDRSGQVMLITGASSGLGAETARALALTGASLILTGRNTAVLDKVRAGLDLAKGAWCRTLAVDQGDLQSVAAPWPGPSQRSRRPSTCWSATQA